MRHVGRVLPRAVENADVLRAARAGAVLRRWDEAVGELLAQKSQPDRYDRGTVWVAVQGSAWAQELRLIKPVILERLEAMSGERGMFLDVRFGVRPPKPADMASLFPDRQASYTEREYPKAEPMPETNVTPTERPSRIKEPGLSIRERAARRLANWSKEE